MASNRSASVSGGTVTCWKPRLGVAGELEKNSVLSSSDCCRSKLRIDATIVHFGARRDICRISSRNVRCEGSLRRASRPSMTTTGSFDSADTKERTSLLNPRAARSCSRESTEKSSAISGRQGRFSALHCRTNWAMAQLFPVPGDPVTRTELVLLSSQIRDKRGLRAILNIVPPRVDSSQELVSEVGCAL